MKSIKITYVLLSAGLLLFTTNIFAQDKKTKAAVAERIKADQEFAKNQRWKYNDDAWKHSWEGAKLSVLYKTWGAPARAFTDEEGGQIVEYETVTNSSGGSYTPGYTMTTQTMSGAVLNEQTVASRDTRWTSQSVRITAVYVNKEGVILKVSEHYK